MFGLITKKYHNSQIDSLKKELDEKLRDAISGEAKNLSARSFNMANVNRLTNHWLSFAKSFNYDISAAGAKMIARSRELAQNDPYAKKILRLLEKNVVGPKGFLFRNKSGDYMRDEKTGEYTFVFDKLANLKIEEAFWDWSKKENCTVTGKTSFRKFCQQLIRSAWCDGEVFIQILKGKSYGKYAFQLKVIDPIYCDHKLTKDLGNGNAIVMGVEVNSDLKPLRYWFRKTSAYKEVQAGYMYEGNYDVVEAENIIHLYIQEVPGQIRGITQFAPAGIRMKMLYSFEESALMRSNISARVPGIIEKQATVLGPNGIPALPVSEKDSNDDWIMSLADGEFLKPKDGYQIKNLESDYPHPMHKEATKVILRGVCAGNDVPYSSTSGDYESVTWHSAKQELGDARDGYRDLQESIIEDFCNIVVYHFLEMGMFSGAIKLPLEKLQKFYAPNFIGRGWEYTNPKEEVDADISGLDAGLYTLEDRLAKRGIDLDEHFDQLAREAQKRKEWKQKFGVEFNWSKPANNNPNQPKSDDKNTDDKTNNSNNNNGNGKLHAINLLQ